MFIYGFGQNVDNTAIIANIAVKKDSVTSKEKQIISDQCVPENDKQTQNEENALQKTNNESNTKGMKSGSWKCSCGRVNNDYESSCVCGMKKWEEKNN